MSSEGNGQSLVTIDKSKPKTDTICFPVEQAKKVFGAAQQRDILLKRIELLQNDVQLYKEELAQADSIIVLYKQDERINKRIIDALEEQKDLLAQNIVDYQKHIKVLEKDVVKYQKRAKRNARLGIIGTAVGFGLGVMIAK